MKCPCEGARGEGEEITKKAKYLRRRKRMTVGGTGGGMVLRWQENHLSH